MGQRGRGGLASIGSRELDYSFDDDGLHLHHGPYDVTAPDVAAWSRCWSHLGALAAQVHGSGDHVARRYVQAAKQFLGVAANLYRG